MLLDGMAAFDAAYRATTYLVRDGFARIPLRIGERSAALDRLLARRRAREAFVVAADNPGSRRLPEAANRRARLALPPGPSTEARADAGGWPVEHGVLALVNERAARRLLSRFRQRAAVHVARGRPAVLLYARAGYFGR
jgi:hypothetical protein